MKLVSRKLTSSIATLVLLTSVSAFASHLEKDGKYYSGDSGPGDEAYFRIKLAAFISDLERTVNLGRFTEVYRIFSFNEYDSVCRQKFVFCDNAATGKRVLVIPEGYTEEQAKAVPRETGAAVAR